MDIKNIAAKNRFLIITLTIQIAIWGLILLNSTGIDIPLIRQVVGFFYLSFIPGYLILRFLKLHTQDFWEILVYSMGLSLSSIMLLGYIINALYPLMGISRPISLLPIIFSLTFVVFLLCAVIYIREKKEKYNLTTHIKWSDFFSPHALFLYLLPLLAILGTSLVNLQKSNFVLLLLLGLISFIAILVAFNRFIPGKIYPLAILMMSFSLLWHSSLVSLHLGGYDVNYHYWLQKVVIDNSRWDVNMPGAMANSMLGLVILTPIYSIILNLDSVWIFKSIYSALLSIAPLALFLTYRKQLNPKIAFLGAFFFMSMPVFYFTTQGTITQLVAEIFLALTIFSLVNERFRLGIILFTIIFSLSLAVSHYATSYYFAFLLLIAMALQYLIMILRKHNFLEIIKEKLSIFTYKNKLSYSSFVPSSIRFLKSYLSWHYVALFVIFTLTWYIYVSGVSFYTVVDIFREIYTNFYEELLSVEAREGQAMQAVGLASMRGKDIEWEIARIIQYFIQFFIIMGIIKLILGLRKTSFYTSYISMALSNFFILVLSIILPLLTAHLSMARIYHLTLFILAPFCITGAKFVFSWLIRLFPGKQSSTLRISYYQKPLMMLILVPYFLFSTGFIFELTGATSVSRALSSHREDWGVFTIPDLYGHDWLVNIIANDREKFKVEGDVFTSGILFTSFGYGEPSPSKSRLMFLRSWNIKHLSLYSISAYKAQVWPDPIQLTKIQLESMGSGIYDNGSARILKSY